MRISDWSSDVCSSDLMAGRERMGKEMAGMAKSLERDSQVESVLRGRTRELGFEMDMSRGRSVSAELTQQLGIGRDRGLSRSGEVDGRGRLSRRDQRRSGASVRAIARRGVGRSEEHTSESQALM